ncbi:S8 family serine peptidase [Aquabacterium sp.]|uniref:S8 family serine peptidase n=1 Tax=Aquabacterium sp. TaxID=1872578 RepID=UPI002CA44822|nr:S8 family serine peptidase [Aquabacterium sp.]HSW06006.1 S8 family serine peptidase [Aquabacterium sp.]
MTTSVAAEGKAPASFNHPTAGPSRVDPGIVAVFWQASAQPTQKAKLLDELALSPLNTGQPDQAPLVQVNQTDRLSWVSRADNAALDPDVLKRLEASEWVEWISPALRPLRSPGGAEAKGAPRAEPAAPPLALFTINPTRFYVRQAAFERHGGAAAIGPALSVGLNQATRLRGFVTVNVQQPSYAAGRSTLHMAAAIAQALGGPAAVAGSSADLRFETIPLLSPRAHGEMQPVAASGLLSCRPPSTEFTPDDPMFAQQWGLQRVGAPRGWQMARGVPGVTVAVIDEGVELGHPDLALHPQSWNASTDLPDGSPTGSHGTACAGIIGARLDNGQGVAGIAGGVRIMAIATATWADVDIAEGLYFAADNGARVVSMSFGVYASWNFWDFDLIRDALQYAHDQGLVLVAASGNENGNVARFPGSDSRTLCVGGSNRSDERKRIGDASSEAWWGASYGPDVDVVAPCLEMPTTDRLGGQGYALGDYHDHFNGTSSATPVVAGLAALLLSMRPTLSSVEVRQIIESTCDKISPALYAYANVPGKPSGTWHEEVGYGRINVERALLQACQQAPGCKDSPCSGCGGCCSEATPAECRSPAPVPWLPFDRCMVFYESRIFEGEGREGGIAGQQRLRLRVTYEHCLKLVGRQQGPLLYTTTLLPGEEVRLFEYDRYRRTRSETQRVSVHTAFRQTLSALSQSRRASSSSAYFDSLTEIRTHADTSVSAGGGLAGFFGAPTVKGETGFEAETSVASGGTVRTASEQFTQLAITASQAMEAERSTVVSTFEEQEHISTTARTLKNHNHCYAVTYFVRRVNEVYEVHTRITSIEWRLGDGGAWRSVDDLNGLPDALRQVIEAMVRDLLKQGQMARDARVITVPTDGTLYEPELAHCASCEPTLMAEQDVRLEQLRLQARRACLETELLEIEVARRRALVSSPQAATLELGLWSLGRPELVAADGGH